MTALSQAFEARGEIKGKRESIQRVLRRRFGALPKAVEQRIGTAPAEQLDDPLDRAVSVERLDVF